MSFEEWLYREAEQNAHNEILAFLTMIFGLNLLLGGLIVTMHVNGVSISIPFITKQLTSLSSIIGLFLTVAGFLILSTGFVLAIYYDREMAWYISQIKKSTIYKKKDTLKIAHQFFEEYSSKKNKN